MTVRLLAILLVLAAAGCDKTSTEPSTPSTPTASTEAFEATLSRGDSMFFSFTANTSGTVSVTLASVVQQGRPGALAIPLRIGLGTPEGEGCTVTDSVEATPALAPQLTATMSAGIHCVSVADAGQTTGTVIAAIRFSHL